ncbi:MAG TPA: BamA/TamA family outer membrane protein [Gemmatimonadales bacterium]|nr:BamA/TamA family outer membrane protein [Gemmatimonadales bacterium]
MTLALVCTLVPAALAGQEPLRPEQRVVRQLKFEGNSAISSETLASVIGTSSSSWFARYGLVRWIGLGAKRYFDETEFRRDVLRLEVLYKRSGYPDVAVDTVVQRTNGDVYLTFRIHEGRPIRLSEVRVTGLDSVPEPIRSAVTVDLPLRAGDPFNRYLMQATADSVVQRLRNRGYPSARVYTAFESNREKYTATVTLDAAPGEYAVFGPARVEGTRTLSPTVVQDLLTARPGRPFVQADLLQSQRNLYTSDLVSAARVDIDSTNWAPGVDTVPLVVNVSESRPYRIRSSVGYATQECFRVSAAWTARNFLGAGRLFDVTGQASNIGVGGPLNFGLRDNVCAGTKPDLLGTSKLNYNVAVTVRRPAFVSPQNTLAVSLFAERRSEFLVYVREDIGSRVDLSRITRQGRLPVSLTYNLSYGRTLATPASFCAYLNACTPDIIAQLQQRQLLASLSGRVSWPRANSPIDPSRGYNAQVEVTWASKYLGSSSLQQFTRFLGDIAWYRPLSRDVVVSWRLRGGLIFSPHVAVGTLNNAFVPPEQRFYAGGPNDVRGFGRNELGPIVYVVQDTVLANAGSPAALPPDSVQVSPIGANTLLVGNLEIRAPSPVWPSRLRLAAFVDAGSLWERGAAGPSGSYKVRVTPGVGLRIATPLGPARLDVAYNGYKPVPGQLYSVSSVDSTLTLVADSFAIDRRSRFFGVPVTFQFSVGQPF